MSYPCASALKDKQIFIFKTLRIVHSKMKILSFTHPKPVWMSLFCWTQRKIFWRMWETEQFWAPLTSIVFFSPTMEVKCAPKTAWLQTFFIISSFVFSRTKTFKTGLDPYLSWGWVNYDNFHFWGEQRPLKEQSPLNKSSCKTLHV